MNKTYTLYKVICGRTDQSVESTATKTKTKTSQFLLHTIKNDLNSLLQISSITNRNRTTVQSINSKGTLNHSQGAIG